jgi:VWFA-related protein
MIRQKRFKPILLRLVQVLLGALIVGVQVAIAQETGPTVVVSQVNDQNFPRVTARVTVIDDSGLAIDNLGPNDFLVWEDNQAVRNVSAMPVPPDQAEPISLVLALDVSGSMDEADENGILKIDAARAEAKSLLNTLGPNDQVAIISFSEGITVEQPFTSDRAALQAAVDRLQLDGDTALNNALFEAADLTDTLPRGKKAIILLTDGLNTFGDLTLDDALDRAKRSGVPVYTVGFFTSGIDPALRTEAEAALTRIATVTNGRYFAAPTAEELGVTFQTLALLLRLQYELSFESALVADCETHELKVRVSYKGQDGDDFDVLNACVGDVEPIFEGPSDGDTVSKSVSFTPQVAPPVRIEAVEYQVDGTSKTLTSPPFSFDWDVTYVPPGSHTLTARVTDSIGNVHSIERTITVVPPLALQIIAPMDGEEVSRQMEARVEVSGPGEVARVEFVWDEELLGTVTTPPFDYNIDTKQYLDGEYTLLVRAYEVDGYKTEETITVIVKAVTTNAGLWIALGLGILILALVIPLGIRARRRAVIPTSTAPARTGPVNPTVSTAPSAWLEVVRGSMPGQRFALSEVEATLGRSRTENDIHTPGRTASRQQAIIKVSDGLYVFYDLNPTNPTIINGHEIAGSHELYEGDQIEIGDMTLKFTYKER